ncbi:hypothetical protein C8Q76DRAFT_761945 [Earliella scabrosa]|nr:hypothetical protein C8Q76DRAFT_761945 [Earliella scabrosa]
MAPPVSEDIVRTLSRLVFACIPSGQSTIKLFDPVTGQLESYQLVKVSDEVSAVSGCMSPPGRARMPPEAFLDDLVSHLKGALVQDLHTYLSGGQMHAAIPSQRKPVSTPPLVSLGCRSNHGATFESNGSDTYDDSGSSASDTSSFEGSLFRPRRAPHSGKNDDTHHLVSPFPLLPPGRSPWEDCAPSLLREPMPWDIDSSDAWSRDPTPVKAPSSHRVSPMYSPVMIYSTPRSSSPVGLGLAMFNIDGSSFDGLGLLPGDDSRVSSPTDEACTRAHQRRGLRGGQSPTNRTSKITNKSQTDALPAPCLKKPKGVRFSNIPSVDDDDFGYLEAAASTPLNAPPRVTPSAPPRRVIGRLPVEFAKARRPTRSQSLLKSPREAPSPSTAGQGALKRASSATSSKSLTRHECCSSSKHSPTGVATPVNDPLRFWTYWMTPASEKNGRKATWRP